MRGYNKNTEEKAIKKYDAYHVYNRALRKKDLIPAERCQNCLSKDDNLHGHHVDYDAPLDVVWLCRRCHGRIHSESQFIDDHKCDSFRKRTAPELCVEEKEKLYHTLGLNKFKRIPLEQRCSLEELAHLNEIDSLHDEYMKLYIEARRHAQYYFQKGQVFRDQLKEKYHEEVEQIY